MTDIPASAFLDKTKQPTAADVKAVLGRSGKYWDEIQEHLRATCGVVTPLWKCTVAKYGWSLRLLYKKRVMFYLIPLHKSFDIAFVLGERACQAVKASKTLPRRIREIVDRAPKYVEGRGFRVPVKLRKDTAGLEELVAIKRAH